MSSEFAVPFASMHFLNGLFHRSNSSRQLERRLLQENSVEECVEFGGFVFHHDDVGRFEANPFRSGDVSEVVPFLSALVRVPMLLRHFFENAFQDEPYSSCSGVSANAPYARASLFFRSLNHATPNNMIDRRSKGSANSQTDHNQKSHASSQISKQQSHPNLHH